MFLMEDDYSGKIIALSCKICLAEDPCNLFDSGIEVGFHTNFNTFYDSACLDAATHCDANRDHGATALVKFKDALNYDLQELFITKLQKLLISNVGHGLD